MQQNDTAVNPGDVNGHAFVQNSENGRGRGGATRGGRGRGDEDGDAKVVMSDHHQLHQLLQKCKRRSALLPLDRLSLCLHQRNSLPLITPATQQSKWIPYAFLARSQ